MLHIILFILKILGLLVLIVLGLVLAVALLILLVPVRYQAEGSYDGKVRGKARITWLLHILSVSAQYEEDLIVRVRIFGFRIGKPKKMDSELKEAEDIMVQAMEIIEPEPIREALEVKDEIHDRVKEEPKNLPPPKEELRSPTPPKEEPKKKKGFRVMGVFEKLKKKVLRAFTKLKFFFLRICDTLRTIKDKKDEIYAWISNKENQKTGKLLFRQVKRLVRHILPRRGKGNITFGFDDPYLTGQVLTYASVIYPLCHKHLNLYPVFDQTVFTVEGTFRGRIRMGTVLLIGSRMLLDRNFRRLLKGWLHKGGIA
ncbi:DUF2953 domain-containing protein [Lacrimispora sphenoides]|uniref:DUF2953 domain-containing protein n=1 Tax=Lacrimispora sphenoides JCM 1415 TaxID=1297793 RepID=A0ABY1C637_9FIRM|nr:DUF2953 domain-containing protein [Lacrimispora sphenoides]SET72848.1 Protein of unknown function [[Clostridium] sphenoides JCM 1415]SUY50804.1 Uncharacterised protein [Lacrimispora sphenoides]